MIQGVSEVVIVALEHSWNRRLTPDNNSSVDLTQAAMPEDFESALRSLEQCIATMERGDLTLEASLLAYQRGVELAQICQQKLQMAQQRVQVLEADLLKPLDSSQEDSDR